MGYYHLSILQTQDMGLLNTATVMKTETLRNNAGCYWSVNRLSQDIIHKENKGKECRLSVSSCSPLLLTVGHPTLLTSHRAATSFA